MIGSRKKLYKWKVTNIAIRGRSALLKSVLGSLGTFLMSIFLMLVGVVKIHILLFFGGDVDNRKMHWVTWDVVLVDKKRWS